MADRQVRVKLTAQVQEYVEGMQKAAQATRETGSESEKLAMQTQAMEKMGRTMLVAGGAMAAGLVLSAKAAIDWDSAWAGVLKTVDGSETELAAVEDGLRGLTAILPATHAEIAAVAEAAGQLGIETPNVVAFTKTMIDLGETTNLSSEQAAMSLARFMNIMGTSQDQVSNLGSALVGLGNNFATTESEILEMSMRLSKSGVQIGLSEGEVLGLATALSSVGIEAEAGGSAMSKVMIDIASSVEAGGDRLEMFAKTAGMSADQFAAKWKTEPAAALAAFVKGLANAESQGGSTLGVLAELGITEVRMRDALLGSAAAADKFAGAMAMGNEEFEKNNALTNEAEKRYDTTAAKLSIMGNRVTDAAISLGEHFLPAIEVVADGIGGLAEMLSGLDGPMGSVVAWGSLLVAGTLLIGGTALVVIPQIGAYKVALETLNISMSSVGSGASKLIGFLGNPWVLGITAAAAVIGVLVMENQRLHSQALALADTLDDQTGAITANSKAWAANELQTEGVLSSAKKLGISASDMTDAWLGNEDALARVNVQLDKWVKDSDFRMDNADWKGWSEDISGVQYALEGSNEVLAQAKTRHDELAEATDGVSEAQSGAESSTDDQAAALEGLQGVVKDTSSEVSKLADGIRNFGSAQFDVENATIKFHDALADLEEQLGSGQASLDVTTEAGRNTHKAMLDVASSTNDYAASLAATGATTDEIAAALEAGRQRIINTRIALGDSEAAAIAYADSLIATPETIATAVQLNGVGAAEDALNNLVRARIASIEVRASMPDLNGGGSGGGRPGFADGAIVAYENGGIQEFAGGGFPTGIYSGGAPIHKFAEPETGWEAYISGKPSERDRNRQIWADTGSRLGMYPGEMSSGPTQVSLAGATFVASIDGRPFTMMIQEQVAGAFGSASSGALASTLGGRRG